MNDMMNFLMNMMQSGSNPKQMALQLLQQQDNPMTNHLLQLANSGDSAALEKIARNLCQQRGVNFDQAFGAFKSQFGFK